MPTRTINRLHFSDLDPGRFEDLCLKLLSREPDWKELSHPGRSGNDGGIDIHGTRTVNGPMVVQAVQKRPEIVTFGLIANGHQAVGVGSAACKA
ncbi:MAG: restriction endonuclease [Flavobacteriales bacterium]|nr:restriction endonuclease [Flavobacteriales bacterium]